MKKFLIICSALVLAGLSVFAFSNKIEKALDNELLEANVEALAYMQPACSGPKEVEWLMAICKCTNSSACSDKHGCGTDGE